MRYAITTIACLVVLLGAARPADSQTPASCEANPGKVVRQHDGTGVKAQPVTITCSGAWQLDEAILWSPTTGSWVNGKWTFGGDRTLTGRGSYTISAFARDYQHCAWWKLRATLNGQVYDGPITRFCSA